ncbi:MAG: hypothetical protein H6579_06505 [Chitinophagales bacterium]|nr:hypothetical protein [Chitinophagales bacterium]
MKKVILLASVLLLLASCKDDNTDIFCEGPDCPLLDGSTCKGPLINVNNNCVCPEGTTYLNDSTCMFQNQFPETNEVFFFEITCECLAGDLMLSITKENPVGGFYSLDPQFHPQGQGRVGYSLLTLPGSTVSDFSFALQPAYCEGKLLYLHGNLQNDTINYELFFLNGFDMDTCGPFQSVAFP